MVKRFLTKVTAISRAQMTRLIAQWVDQRPVERKPARRPTFARRYRNEDIQLLAVTDVAHEDLSGPALRRILHREHSVFGKAQYERLSRISVAHIYNPISTTLSLPAHIAVREARRPVRFATAQTHN